jgi:uncharacterized repeat protein (TIGR03803 family)
VTTAGVETTLHGFCSNNVGNTLYGTTVGDTQGDNGTVYSVSTPSAPAIEEPIYYFQGLGDGAYPQAGLVLVNGTLYGTTQGASRAEIDLPAQPGRKRRTALLAVRFATMSLARPDRRFRAGLPEAVSLQLADVRELCPPPGQPAVHWRLLTTHPVADAAQAWAVAERYRKRWAIEQLFRTLKTQGFDIEGLRIEDPAPRDKLVTAALIAAVAIQQLVHARDGGPGPLRPCTDVFQPEDMPLLEAFCAKLEGRTARQKNPHPKGSLAYAAWVCARLGGRTGYYGKPGPVVMLQGWLEIQAAKRGITTLGLNHDV